MSEEVLVGRYRRIRTLGRGGMGEVWLAEDLELGRHVAVKRLHVGGPGSIAPDPELVERMTREARVVARLNHPAIVTLHDLVRVDGSPFLIMEYVEGESLADTISREGTIDWRVVAPIIAEIAGALAAAHRKGVLHRDIKPANILLDLDGHAHLADFGIARGTDDVALTRAGELVGTVAYMAPEVARTNTSDARSDVWSLGATFFAATEGGAPFADSGASIPAMIARLITDDAPPPRRAGPLSGLLTRMLATDPAVRPTAAQVVVEVPRLTALPDEATGAVPLSDLTVENAVPVTGEIAHPAHHPPSNPPTGVLPGQPPPTPTPPTAARHRSRAPLAALAAAGVVGAAVAGYLVLGTGEGSGSDPDRRSASSAGTGSPSDPTGTGASGTLAPGPFTVGAVPGNVTLNAAGTRAYVPATEGSSISVVNLVNGTVREVDVGTSPGQVVLNSDGTRAYTPTDDGTLVAFDTRTLATDSVALPGMPARAMVSPDDTTLYVPTDNGISVVDAADLTVRDTIGSGAYGEISLSPDGTQALARGGGPGLVTVVDLATDAVQTIEVGGSPNNVVVANRSALALSSNQDGYISVIDTDTMELVGTIDTPGVRPGRVTFTKDDATVLCPYGKGRVLLVIDMSTRTIRQRVDLEGQPLTGVVLDPSGTTGYFPDKTNGRIATLDVAGETVGHLDDGGPTPQSVTVSPDGTRLYTTDGVGTLTAVDLPPG